MNVLRSTKKYGGCLLQHPLQKPMNSHRKVLKKSEICASYDVIQGSRLDSGNLIVEQLGLLTGRWLSASCGCLGDFTYLTGLTGLAVAPTPQHTLSVIYTKLQRVLDKMPNDAAYKKYTEEIVKTRSSIVSQAKSVEEIEQKINCGQVEEIIIQAENELKLARTFANCKPWEPLIAQPPKGQWAWPPTK